MKLRGLLLGVLLTLSISSFAHAAPMRVAVLEFTNASTSRDYDPLGKGLQSMITTDLTQVPSLQLVERSRLHEVQAELKLQAGSSIDPSTAVKLGKLAGATHLLAGSFTVVGSQMRVDARLFGVSDGAVLLAAKDEGDKDAFFDLEKSLVKKLVETVGVKLAPKERAELNRMHTLDFDAFAKFSRGIALFDEKKYSDAIAALKDASARDKDFRLAALTLGEYERVITEMRTEATNLEAKQKEMARLTKELQGEKEAKAEADSVARLYEIAKSKDPTKRRQRLAALFVLALEHGYDLLKLAVLQDFFALQRTSDALALAYFSEASPRFAEDKLPLVILPGYSSRLPSIEKFDHDFAYLVETFGRTSNGEVDVHRVGENLRTNLLQTLEFAQRLHFDRRQGVALLSQLLAHGRKLKPGTASWWTESLRLAQEHRRLLDLDKSTTLLTSLAAETKDPSQLRDLADEIERNKQLKTLLETHKRPVDRYFREYILLRYPDLYPHQWEYLRNEWEDHTKGGDLSPKALHLLASQRRLPYYPFMTGRKRDVFGYLLMGDHPVWALHSKAHDPGGSMGTGMHEDADSVALVSGPRTDERRASELRFYSDAKHTVEPILLIDGLSKREVSLRFAVSHTPAPDWWPPWVYYRDKSSIADVALEAGRPEVGFVFGLRNVDAPRHPLSAQAVIVGGEGQRLVELVENPVGSKEPYKLTTKSEQRGDVKAATFKVAVKLSGDTLRLTVDGKTSSWKVSGDREGFYGIYLRGRGYAAISNLEVD